MIQSKRKTSQGQELSFKNYKRDKNEMTNLVFILTTTLQEIMWPYFLIIYVQLIGKRHRNLSARI